MSDESWELPEGMERCSTCGRFVEIDESFADLPPDGLANVDYIACYCNEQCADNKPGRCWYEDDPDYDAECERRFRPPPRQGRAA